MRLLTTLLLAASCIQQSLSTGDILKRPVRYDNQLLIQLPNSKKLSTTIARMDLDVWARTKSTMDVRVTPAQLRTLKQLVPSYKVLKSNIQRDIDQETKQLNEQLAHPAVDWFAAYHRYADIVSWMRDLAKNNADKVVMVESIGKSVEGRDIPMLKITGKPGPKKAVVYTGLQHAREWIATATVQYIANQLATSTSPDVVKLLDAIEFYLVPLVNPDGYEYTWTTDRYLRKNRALVNGKAVGVDLNRNWPDHWGGEGSSGSPSSDTYRGPTPGSEPEVQAVMKLAKSLTNVIGFIDFHSYSQLVLRPYSWTSDLGPDEATFKKIGDAMAAAIQGVAGNSYTSQTGADLYAAAGGVDDWFYGNYTTNASTRRAYGMTIELSPKDAWGLGGFVLSPDRIIPVGKELMPAVIKFADYVLNNPLPTGRPW